MTPNQCFRLWPKTLEKRSSLLSLHGSSMPPLPPPRKHAPPSGLGSPESIVGSHLTFHLFRGWVFIGPPRKPHHHLLLHSFTLNQHTRIDSLSQRLEQHHHLLGAPLLHSFTRDPRHRLERLFWLFLKLRYTSNFLGNSLLSLFTRDQRHRLDGLIRSLRNVLIWLGSSLLSLFTRD